MINKERNVIIKKAAKRAAWVSFLAGAMFTLSGYVTNDYNINSAKDIIESLFKFIIFTVIMFVCWYFILKAIYTLANKDKYKNK